MERMRQTATAVYFAFEVTGRLMELIQKYPEITSPGINGNSGSKPKSVLDQRSRCEYVKACEKSNGCEPRYLGKNGGLQNVTVASGPISRFFEGRGDNR
ncbi:hypothetical protein [Paenibacillus agricola]|uniref:hypothetical protein n=1 Tax=Paenibacillus agricola TaxID=2716264 RepID=UPI001A9E0E3A|nr:hypothetical protein [Paenibacillus agricola]